MCLLHIYHLYNVDMKETQVDVHGIIIGSLVELYYDMR